MTEAAKPSDLTGLGPAQKPGSKERKRQQRDAEVQELKRNHAHYRANLTRAFQQMTPEEQAAFRERGAAQDKLPPQLEAVRAQYMASFFEPSAAQEQLAEAGRGPDDSVKFRYPVLVIVLCAAVAAGGILMHVVMIASIALTVALIAIYYIAFFAFRRANNARLRRKPAGTIKHLTVRSLDARSTIAQYVADGWTLEDHTIRQDKNVASRMHHQLTFRKN